MKANKKAKGIESLRRRYGYSFVAHWIFGLIVFFAVPLIYSIIYSFSDIEIGDGGFVLTFAGLKNYSAALLEDPNYLDDVRDSIISMFYSLPMIIALSFILAVLLNQKYRGRTVMRIIFFLPVIIESSVVVRLLSDPSINSPIFNFSTEGQGIMDYDAILGNLSLPSQITDFLTFFLKNAVSLTWSCGVQIILFLAGLQSIPESLYEVSRIEGANKWEEFWQITVPMLRHVLSLVIIYTMISKFTASDNTIVSNSIELMRNSNYSSASAMLWFYFVIVLAVIGLVLFLYNRFCLRKWD
ncbi:MAG: sugar ABC transporter permease [Clostridia bacterium]|nr:sugar ABC transporter permease [Clostridia bacterium]